MRYTNQQSSSSSVSVFSHTATLPLSAYLSHAHAGVTFPRRCCCRLTLAARVRQTAVRGVFRRHWTDRRTDVQTDGETDGRQTVAYPMLDAASGNNFHSLRIINICRCFYTGVGGGIHVCMTRSPHISIFMSSLESTPVPACYQKSYTAACKLSCLTLSALQ